MQAWTGPECSSKLRFPDFVTTAQDGGKAVSLTHQQPLPQEILLVLISVRGWVDPRAVVRSGFNVNEKFQWHRLESNQRPSNLWRGTLTAVLLRSGTRRNDKHLQQDNRNMGITDRGVSLYYCPVPIGHHARYCSTHISQFPYHGVPGTGVLETGLDLSCAFCNSLARSSSSDFFLASSSSTAIFSSFSLSLSGSLVVSPFVTAGWVGVGWLGGSASPSDNSLGLTEVEGGPAELVTVETPCAAASFAADESKTSHMIINLLHAFQKKWGVFKISAENRNVYSTADYHKHHKGNNSTGYITWYKKVHKK